MYIHMSKISLSLPFSDPTLLPWVQVDKGAIKFILSGANIMCPGLTSPGANLPVDLPEEASVVSSHCIRKVYTVPTYSTVHTTQYKLPSAHYVPSTRFPMHTSSDYTMHTAQYTLCGTCFPVHHTQYTLVLYSTYFVSSMCFPELSTQYTQSNVGYLHSTVVEVPT